MKMNLRRTLTLAARMSPSPRDADLEAASRHLNHRLPIRDRILNAAEHLFAQRGYERTTTKQIADGAAISEGTLFRYFEHKKDVLVTLVSQGWSLLLTDLLIELSELPSDRAIDLMLHHWLQQFRAQSDLFRVALMEIQYHPDLCSRVQTEILSKMTSITEAYISDGITRGTYRNLNPRHLAHIFLSLFMLVSLEPTAFQSPPEEQTAFVETLSDVFLNGIVAYPATLANRVPAQS
ncbi:TetR/AcrR family transcriptional regulator [Lyngbya confervoides]|uniref:TetR/AcrR family transcriptional regulator n=1 Tax=Lyngbya confervoides BDU141951 TaxID=1574623 RepID=A0ABD4T7L5_9CYAN|nr:TetR/AcrR family transcriptional regulator [Lyngbya confervoides]MCM1984708.1 TetR/AcrR family transcriptional regulator [Lyngbya confervoides BDU141951]